MKRGELWLVNLNPGFGRELHKTRPALIISDDSIHEQTSHVVVVPISSQVPSMVGMEMVIAGKKEGLDKKSVILPLFIRSIDKTRLVKKIGKVSKIKIKQVERAIHLILGIQAAL